MANHTGPMVGVRVIDLTAMVMGPYCTQIMADMGADVIKVEPPQGDNTRYISVGPAPGMSGVFVNVNRGKRSVGIALEVPEGRAVLDELVKTADVFVTNFMPSARAKLRLNLTDVRAVNPDIIYVRGTGFGAKGPEADMRLTSFVCVVFATCCLRARIQPAPIR